MYILIQYHDDALLISKSMYIHVQFFGLQKDTKHFPPSRYQLCPGICGVRTRPQTTSSRRHNVVIKVAIDNIIFQQINVNFKQINITLKN